MEETEKSRTWQDSVESSISDQGTFEGICARHRLRLLNRASERRSQGAVPGFSSALWGEPEMLGLFHTRRAIIEPMKRLRPRRNLVTAELE